MAARPEAEARPARHAARTLAAPLEPGRAAAAPERAARRDGAGRPTADHGAGAAPLRPRTLEVPLGAARHDRLVAGERAQLDHLRGAGRPRPALCEEPFGLARLPDPG